MRILLISRCPPYPLHWGDRLIVYHLARELAAQGHEIDLLALTEQFDDLAERQHYADFFASVHLLPSPPRALPGILRRLLLPASRFPTDAAGSTSPEMWAAIRARIAQHHYDVAHFFGGVQVYEYAQAVADVPKLIAPYESYALYLRRELAQARRLSLWLRGWMARRYESFMFAPFARVVVVAAPDADQLRALNPAYRVEVIPNGVDLADFAPMPDVPRQPGLLLFLGNFGYAPNADAAVWLARDVLPLVRQRVPEARLRLVGVDPPPELRALASSAVEVTGRVPDVRPHYAQASAFASGLRIGAGIKNKVLEALAMGCPVVATPISLDGIDAQRHDAALLADATAESFAAALVRALSDDALRARLAQSGRAFVEMRYSWKGVAAQYERLYQRAVEETR
jgi:glycosyltransferase involved in cell wall biosynthesis